MDGLSFLHLTGWERIAAEKALKRAEEISLERQRTAIVKAWNG